jgi:hypothetical protein
MAAQLDDALASAMLRDAERRTVARLIDRFREELAEHLLAVWLYGSRARGDADLEATHVDLRSDVDLMLVVDPESGWTHFGGQAIPLVTEVAEAEGESPLTYSVIIYDSDWLRNRREIRAFFIQDVDRDKLVLYGSALE